jgi:hypothetical protein
MGIDQASFVCVKCCLFLTFNAAFFVIGIVIWVGSTSQYGNAINYETQEWNKGPILDVVASNSSACLNGYEKVYGKFWGLNSICNKGNG